MSPLAVYLSTTKERPARFAARLGVHRGVVWHWMKGDRKPDTLNAYRIEKITEGKVPVVAWLNLPVAAEPAPAEPARKRTRRSTRSPRVA